MPAVAKIETGYPFRFPCVAVACDETFDCCAESKTGARSLARMQGWDFAKHTTLRGKVEVWYCPAHNRARLAAIKSSDTKKLYVYSDERKKDSEDEDNLKQAEKRQHGARNSFQRGFGRILTGAEMTACMKLLAAMETAIISGNATMAYDGAGVDSISYGEKSVSERVIEALTFVRRCKLAVIAGVQMEIHDAWRALVTALIADRSVEDAGHMITRQRRDRQLKRPEAIALGSETIQRAASAITEIRY